MLGHKQSLEARQHEMRQRQPAPRGPGRPPLPIHGEDVREMARRGHTVEEIAHFLRCCPTTLRRRFAAEIEEGHEWLNGRIKQIIWEEAVCKRRAWALKWEAWYRGLLEPSAKPPRLPRGTGPSVRNWFRRRVGRAYQPFRNRYRPGRRMKREPLQFLAPATSLPTKTPAPKPRRAWSSFEIIWG